MPTSSLSADRIYIYTYICIFWRNKLEENLMKIVYRCSKKKRKKKTRSNPPKNRSFERHIICGLTIPAKGRALTTPWAIVAFHFGPPWASTPPHWTYAGNTHPHTRSRLKVIALAIKQFCSVTTRRRTYCRYCWIKLRHERKGKSRCINMIFPSHPRCTIENLLTTFLEHNPTNFFSFYYFVQFLYVWVCMCRKMQKFCLDIIRRLTILPHCSLLFSFRPSFFPSSTYIRSTLVINR